MAREPIWHRSAKTYVDGTEAPGHTSLLAAIAPGQTLTRVRFNFWIGSYATTFPFLNDGVNVGLGLILGDSQTVPPNVGPLTSPAEDWYWWEVCTQLTTIFGYNPQNENFTAMNGPVNIGERDMKAQRTNRTEAFQYLWLITQGDLQPNQGTHYLSYGASVLLLAAP